MVYSRVLYVFVVALAACDLDPYRLEFGSNVDGGSGPVDALRTDAFVNTGPDARPGTGPDAQIRIDAQVCEPEKCDGKDNDCNQVIDNGFDLTRDPANCGQCGNACDDALSNQRGSCVNSQCVYTCSPGFIDCSATAPGCEVACIKTNGGIEACDGIDNDCDCVTDQGFNTQSDVNNCGSCLHVCIALHATPTCTRGACGVGTCEPGYKDLRPDINGCEYRCPIFPPKANDTTCDGVDDDCDGVADDDVPGVGNACATGQPGECAAGSTRCVNGRTICVANNGALPELCDNKDNDCNGAIDNGFDKQNDPAHCGSTCQVCSFLHAFAACTNGRCTLLACEPGWTDADGTPGCEYECTKSGPEVCDGLDNDCDHLIDDADPDLIRPSASFCASRGECQNATLDCRAPPAACGDDTIAWRCVYGSGVQTDSCGNLVGQESLCDGKDNDCDNAIDDAFPQVGTLCADDKVGVCRSTGKFICDPTDVKKQRVICDITTDGQDPTDEVCNGKDDDCDGDIDNDARDDMIHIGGGGDFWIYKYEASRPDATAQSPGSVQVRSCSQAGVLPWALVTWTEADQACQDAGKRLCTEDEWEFACGGQGQTLYPYGNSYQPQFCNGNDYDPNCTGADDDAAQPVGSAIGCPKPGTSRCASTFTGAGSVYDLSGNLREWTSTSVAGNLRRIRGGAYDNVDDALTCRFDFWSQEEDSFYFNLGFRCCSEVGP